MLTVGYRAEGKTLGALLPDKVAVRPDLWTPIL